MASSSRALRLARLHAPLRGGGAASRPLRPFAAAAGSLLPAVPRPLPAHARFLATQPAQSSLRDSSPSWSNRPPKETILLDGCDFEHWLVVMDPPPGDPGHPDITREEIIDGYIKTLAQVVGSEEEARHKIYSVSTRHYFAFGALVSEELSYKLKELPKVRWVLPDSYLDVKNKDYGGEPFINGEAVPYDPKYHEEWVRNNARANERSRRSDRPRNIDRSRNFERRRENMQNFQNRDGTPGQGFNNPPPPGQGFNNHPPPGQGMPHRDAPPMHNARPNAGAPPPYQAGFAPGSGHNYQQGGSPSYNGAPPGYQGGNQGYQGGPGGNMHGGSGPAYQSNPGYQGPGAGYQSGSVPPPPFQGGGQPPFQSGNPHPYQGGGQPPFQSGNPPPYQGGNSSYGSTPSYQGQQGDPSYHNAGAPPFEGSDGPGRNYQ